MSQDIPITGPDHELPAHEAAEDGRSSEQPDESPGLDAERDEARRERDDYRERLLRQTAEFDNYRKRIERERREQAELAAADLVRDILPLVDDLERALRAEAGDDGAAAYRQGVELIHRRLVELLARRGARWIDPLGADFDPRLHEAVAREPAEGRRDGEVIEVFSRGCQLGERLLRPAMVKVATS